MKLLVGLLRPPSKANTPGGLAQLVDSLASDPVLAADEEIIRASLAFRENDRAAAKHLLARAMELDFRGGDKAVTLTDLAFSLEAWADAVKVADAALAGVLDNFFRAQLIVLREVAKEKLGAPIDRAAVEAAAVDIVDAWDTTPDVFTQNRLADALVSAAALTGSPDLASQALLVTNPGYSWEGAAKVSQVVDAVDWCASRADARHLGLEPSSTISFLLGKTRYEYDTEPLNLFTIPSGQVIAGSDFILTDDGGLLQQSIRLARDALRCVEEPELNRIIHPYDSRPHDVPGDVFLLSAPYDHHYGHWIGDYLPRLMALRHLNASEVKIFVPETLPRKFREMLGMFGVSAPQLFEASVGQSYRFERLHFLSAYNNFRPHPTLMRFIYEGLGPKQKPPSERLRLFLTRGEAKRQVQNIDELERLLQVFGFAAVDPAVLSVAEQADLIGRAEIIMGLSGSQLHGFFHAPPGCRLIVLHTPWFYQYSYWYAVACSALGMKHVSIMCGIAKDSDLAADVVLDCIALEKTLRDLGLSPIAASDGAT